MRLHDGTLECSYCGASLDIPPGTDLRTSIRAASGEPNVRRLLLDNREIHSCVIDAENDPTRVRTMTMR